ncbi:MAG TPA: hypothetical protein VJA21_33605 [Verrucomicrobiae bacterium]
MNAVPWNRALLAVLLSILAAGCPAAELVYLDDEGVVRWAADKQEVALFGANYCLPSACDYRAAGYVHADRKKLVEADMAHFARMGWDGLRLCLWGDWENCDKQGNLIVNDHLEVMDYALAQARQRGIYILFTPITTHAAWWPEGKATDGYPGFSKFYDRGELCVNPGAIAAQSNYVWQILRHVNPHTGVALKDEPNVLFVEMINEPIHRGRDRAGVTAYINTVAAVVRSAGCEKILFHNVSQDFAILPAIKASRAQGVTFAWYPTGLNLNRMLTENYLRTVDEYPPMLRADLRSMPKLVYEFDSPDMNSGYMYPAMVRAFRGAGAQFAAMFSYDMLDTAPYNLGWQTHFLNLVHSPRKAVSAIIAAEAMRALPRYSRYGDYPDNRRFGPFRVSYEEDTSELVTDEKFYYANDTRTQPPKPAALQHIVGLGSSPVVDYDGCGIYFLDKLGQGVWRLEVYPDAVIVQDPFAQRLNYRTVSSRLVGRSWPMTVRLPDLGDVFAICGLNAGNSFAGAARRGSFTPNPGVYLLAKDSLRDTEGLPQRVRGIGLREFVCPQPAGLPAQILPRAQASYCRDQPLIVGADVIDSAPPKSVTLHVRAGGSTVFESFSMAATRGYRWEATVPFGAVATTNIEFYIVAKMAAGEARFPTETENLLTARLVSPADPLTLFDADTDLRQLVFSRIGDGVRHGIFQQRNAAGSEPAALRLFFPLNYDRSLDDYTASLGVKARIRDRGRNAGAGKELRVKARSSEEGRQIYLTLVEADGTSWSTPVTLSTNWQEQVLAIRDFKPARGVKLPLGFPGRWNYWLTPANGRGGPGDKPRLETVEHFQISFRPAGGSASSAADVWADIASAKLVFE